MAKSKRKIENQVVALKMGDELPVEDNDVSAEATPLEEIPKVAIQSEAKEAAPKKRGPGRPRKNAKSPVDNSLESAAPVLTDDAVALKSTTEPDESLVEPKVSKNPSPKPKSRIPSEPVNGMLTQFFRGR